MILISAFILPTQLKYSLNIVDFLHKDLCVNVQCSMIQTQTNGFVPVSEDQCEWEDVHIPA